jgi:hypothetical protein
MGQLCGFVLPGVSQSAMEADFFCSHGKGQLKKKKCLIMNVWF